jgi:type II secretory pathway pseudopilin PulG
VGVSMSKQKGFTLVEGLLIVLIISVVGFAGYTVWNNQQDDKNVNSTEIMPANSTDDGTEEYDTSVYEVNIGDLTKVSNIDKLPDFTPESFVSFFTDILEENENSNKDCTASYSIYTISSNSISGGVVPVEEGDTFCGSGAPLRWVNKDGTWKEESVQ